MAVRKIASAQHRADELNGGTLQQWGSQHQPYVAQAPLATFVVDRAGRFVEANAATCRITGYCESELLSMAVADLLDGESAELAQQRLEQAVTQGRASGEICWIRRDGARRWSTCDAIRMSDDRVVAFCLDITQLRDDDASRRERESIIHGVLDAISESVFLLSADGTVLICNPTAAQRLGTSAEQLIGKSVFRWLPTELVPPRKANLAHVLQSRCKLQYEEHRDGYWLEHSLYPVVNHDGTVDKVAVVLKDITERKHGEMLLREATERLSLAQQAAEAGVWDWNLVSGEINWSPEMFSLFGLDPQSTPASLEVWEALLHPADRVIASQRIRDCIDGGEILNSEYRIIHPDGQTRWILAMGKTNYDDTGQAIRMAGFCVDITEQKNAEHTLRQSEKKLRLAMEAAEMGTWTYTFADQVCEFGENAQRLYGLPQAKFHHDEQGARSLFHPDDIPAMWQAVEQAGDPQGPGRYHTHYRVRRSEGGWRWLSVWGQVEFEGEGENRVAVRMIGASRDVTQQRQAERQLRLQSLVLNQIQDSVTITDLQGIVTYVNEAQCHTLKRTRSELLGQPVSNYGDSAFHGATQPEIIHHTLTQGIWRGEVANRNSHGQEIAMDCRTRLIRDEAGQPVAMCGIGTDITQRRKMEESLRESEAKYRTLYETMSQGVLYQRADGVLIDANNAALKMFGVTRDEFLRRRSEDPQWQAVREDGSPMPVEEHPSVKALATGRPVRDVVAGVLNPRTQSQVWMEVNAIPEFLPGETSPHRVVVTLHDITQRKETERALRDSEIFLRQTERIARVGGWEANPHTDHLRWTEGIYDIIEAPRDYRPSLSEGIKFFEAEYIPVILDCLKNCLATGEPFLVECPAVTVHEKRLWTEVRGLMSVVEKGNAYVIGTLQEITQRKEAEEERLRLEAQVLHTQKLESLGILAGGIAHDFNNILAGILGYADLARARLPAAEPAREDLNVIKRAVQRAADLTRQMLAYAGQGKFVVEPVDLSQIVEDARQILEVSVSKKATLRFQLSRNLPAIQADASQIYQVVLNLVVNASEALGDNTGTISISTDALYYEVLEHAHAVLGSELPSGRYVELKVVDTGCGIDEGSLQKLFDPFFTTKFTGRGLGLAAVHGIVRGHHGAIRVISQPGHGSTFQVLFPACDVEISTTAEPRVAATWQGRGTVLVAEDEVLLRHSVQRMIEMAGFQVLAAGDGEEAVELYRQHHQDIVCVLLDLTMPKMGGEETFSALQEIHPGLPIILTSGYREEHACEPFSGRHLAGFLQKPYQSDELVEMLRRAVTGDSSGAQPHA